MRGSNPAPGTTWWCNANWFSGKIVALVLMSSSLMHHPLFIALSSNGSGYKATNLGVRVRLLPEQPKHFQKADTMPTVLASPYFFCFLIGFDLFLQQLFIAHHYQSHVLVFEMLLCHAGHLFRRDSIDVFHPIGKVAVA